MDTKLRVTDPSLERQRTEIAQALMESLAIVEPFDERKDFPARLVPRVIRLVMDQFILEGAEEALRHRIVVPVAFPAHARRHAEAGEDSRTQAPPIRVHP